MKYVEGSLKPGHEYKQRKMTAANSAIHVDYQIRLYCEWAMEQGLKVIHIFKPAKTGYARWAYECLLKQPLKPSTRLVEVVKGDFL